VENNNTLRVTVEAMSDGIDYRLGEVETADPELFRLPNAVEDAFDLHLRVDPIGSPATYVSDEIVYSPGDHIDVEVESDLDFTTVTIR